MEALFVAFISGNLLANNFPTLLSLNECLVTVCLFFALIWLGYFRLASGLAGFVSVSLMIILQTSWQPSSADVGTDIIISGRVSTLVKVEKDQIRFNFELNCLTYEQLQLKKADLTTHSVCSSNNAKSFKITPVVRLSWYQANFTPQQGNHLILKVRLKPIYGLHNQAGFDYQKWLISEGIVATGYIKQARLITQHASADLKTGRVIERDDDIAWRQVIFNYYDQLLVDFTYRDILIGLLMGERQLMDDNRWRVLRETGTAHLMAISGLHLGMVFIWSWGILKVLFRPIFYFLSTSDNRFTLISALCCMWCFCALTGFALPAVRAGIFISVFSLFSIFAWHTRLRFRFLLACCCILILFPLSPLSQSFWLSFCAVASVIFIIWWLPWIKKTSRWRGVKLFLWVQLGLTILLMPLQIILFQHVSVSSLLANYIAIPSVSFVILPLTLLAGIVDFMLPIKMNSQSLSGFLFEVADYLIDLLWRCLTWFAEFDFGYIAVSELSIWHFILIFVCLCFLFLPIKSKYKGGFLILPICLLVLLLFNPALSDKQMKHLAWQLSVLDVGQGLAVIIRRGNQAVLYDTGDAYRSGFNLFEAAVEPVLIANNLTLIAVVISHADKDHSGGVNYIQRYYPKVPIWQGEQGCKRFSEQNYLALNWQFISNPMANQVNSHNSHNSNNQSCVYKISGLGHSALLTGDIEIEKESELVQFSSHDHLNHLSMPKQGDLLAADILLVPHHGSKTSSSAAFIQAVKPEYAVISRGLFNRFNHPHHDVVQRYLDENVSLLDTAEQGQIDFIFDMDGIILQTYANDLSFTWHSKIIRGDLSQVSD